MNSNELAGVARAILAACGGYFVSRGLVDEATLQQIIGAVITLGVAAWSIWAKRRAAAATPPTP